MDFNKFWKQFKKDADPGKLLDVVTEVIQRSRDASDAAKSAERAYFESVEKKKVAVSTRIAELNEQRRVLEAKHRELKYPLTAALADGDTKELDKIKGDMQALEAEMAQAATEIELLQSAYVRGDDTLYKIVIEKHSRYLELKKAAQEVMRTVYEHGFVKHYEEIESKCSNYFDSRYDTSLGVGANLEELDKNYNAEQRAKDAELERKWRAEQAELSQSRGLVTITRNIRDSDAKATPGYNPDGEDSGSYFAKLSHGISEGYSGPALREAMQRSGAPSHGAQRGTEASSPAPIRPPVPVAQHGAKAETVQERQPRRGYGAFFKW